MPTVYLLSALSIAIGLIGALVYAGYTSWPFLLTVVIGAAAQTLFRVAKRSWRNALEGSIDQAESDKVSIAQGLKYIVLIYLLMLPISALWYGVGRLAQWIAT